MLLENSLYATCDSNFIEKFAKTRHKHRKETIFRLKNNLAYLHEEEKKTFIFFYGKIDRNKQRSCISIEIEKFEVTGEEKPVELLKSLGFVKVAVNYTESYIIDMNKYVVECFRFKKSEEIVDSSEEEAKLNEQLEEESNKENEFTVKVFCYTDDVLEGEKILSGAYEDLGIKLIVPDIKNVI
ncbi:hypothetical protein NUSPORA_00314 [Nucleospora cyclopteri]